MDELDRRSVSENPVGDRGAQRRREPVAVGRERQVRGRPEVEQELRDGRGVDGGIHRRIFAPAAPGETIGLAFTASG